MAVKRKKTSQISKKKKKTSRRKAGQSPRIGAARKKKTGANRKSSVRKKKGSPQKSQPAFTTSVNPATFEEVGQVPHTDLSRMPEIMAAAREAQENWAALSFEKRARHIRKMRDYIVQNADELARIVSLDQGKSRIDALATEIIPCALACDWYARNAARNLRPKKLARGSILFFNKKNTLLRLPLGVVGIISPWNYPLSIPFGEIVMGLMAGNAVLLKVAAATIMVGEAIERIMAAGNLPPGLFHHIVGSGGQVSTAFFDNRIDKIFFTGSVPTGKILLRQAADTLTPLSLELGGKDPMIVLPDADLERAANGAAWAGYQNAGQSCGGVERLYVHESVYDEFMEILKQKTEQMRHGPDLDFNTEMGALTTEDQLATVREHVEDAVRSGANIVAQSRPKGEENGYFYPATLVTGVNHEMKLMREETFGPVIPVMKFRTVEEAIQLANDSTMALTSSVWTKNKKLGKEIAARLESGVTTINDHLYTHGQSETPWGGWKESGVGRTHSLLGFEEMTQPKVINWDLFPTRRNIWWFPFNQETYEGLKAALRFIYPQAWGDRVKFGWKMAKFYLKKSF